MLTYTYPASFIPDFTTASAMPLIRSSLTLQANLFQEFQPMGGVSARLAEGEGFSCANPEETKRAARRQEATTNKIVFMRMLYQIRLELGNEMGKKGDLME